MDERVNPELEEEEDLISCDDDEREGKLSITTGAVKGLRRSAWEVYYALQLGQGLETSCI